MGLLATLRNAIQWVGFDLGRADGAVAQGVVLIDPATGLAVSPNSVTLSGPITISNAVEITNDAGNAIPVSGTVSVSGITKGAGVIDSTTLRIATASDDALNANFGATTDAAVTSDANGTVSAKLRGLVKMLSDAWDSTNHVLNIGGKAPAGSAPAANPISVSGIDGSGLKRHLLTDATGILIVQGTPYASQQSVTRPSDTIAYSAGDVIGSSTSATAAINFSNIGPANGHIIITDVDLRIDIASVPTGMSSFRLHLYTATPGSAYVDNAAWDLVSGDRASYLGYIDFGTPQDFGSTLFVQASGINKKLQMGASTSLFAYLQTTAGYTPNSGGVYTVRLNAINC